MPEYGIVIQARSRATRLPDKVLMPFYQDRSILEIITTNLLDTFSDMPVCIVTSSHPADDRVASVADQLGAECLRGDEQNVLSRFLLAGKQYRIKHIVRVCADNPFLDAGSARKLVDAHAALAKEPDYLSYALDIDLPAIKSHIGVFTEIVRCRALARVPEVTSDPQYFEHVTNYLYTHPQQFDVRFLQAPEPVYGRRDIRLTIDTRLDFDLLRKVYADTAAQGMELAGIIDYLDNREDILQKMRNFIARNEK